MKKNKRRNRPSRKVMKRINIRSPKLATNACHEYFLALRKIESFYLFIIMAVYQIDQNAENSYQALMKYYEDPEKRKNMREKWSKRKGAMQQLKKQQQFFTEVILVRHIENFLNYLSSILFEIFTQKPETLRSSDKVEADLILRQTTIKSIVRSIAERKVESLSYFSFNDLIQFISDRFSLAVAPKSQIKELVKAIEIRNISVHNRCRVNQRYVSRTGDKSTPIGQCKTLTDHYLDVLVPKLAHTVISFDKKARQHLKIKGKRGH